MGTVIDYISGVICVQLCFLSAVWTFSMAFIYLPEQAESGIKGCFRDVCHGALVKSVVRRAHEHPMLMSSGPKLLKIGALESPPGLSAHGGRCQSTVAMHLY